MTGAFDIQAETLSERASLVREIAAGAAGDAIQIRGLLALLKAGNPRSIINSLNQGDAGPAARLVQHSLMTRLFLWVCRAYGPVRRAADRHAQVAFDLMKDSSLLAAIEKRGSQAKLAEARTRWNSCRADNRLAQINHLRDKEFAHRGKTDPGISRAVWGPTMEFCADTADAMNILGMGVGVIFDLDEQLRSYERAATNFLSPWAAKGSDDETLGVIQGR